MSIEIVGGAMSTRQSSIANLGLRTNLLGTTPSMRGHIAARYYRAIIGLCASAIVLFSALGRVQWWVAALVVGGYWLYFGLRSVLSNRVGDRFYLWWVQLARAQIGILVTAAALFYLYRAGEGTYRTGGHLGSLWLLFVLEAMIVSEHCDTGWLVITIGEIALLLFGLNWLTLESARPVPIFVETTVQTLWVSLFAFILHYLVRNIEARDDAQTRQRAFVTSLFSSIYTTPDPTGTWEAALKTCLVLSNGDWGTLHLCNYKTGKLEPIVGLERTATGDGEWVSKPMKESPLASYTDAFESNHLRSGIVSSDDTGTLMVFPIRERITDSRVIALLHIGFNRSFLWWEQWKLTGYRRSLEDFIEHFSPAIQQVIYLQRFQDAILFAPAVGLRWNEKEICQHLAYRLNSILHCPVSIWLPDEKREGTLTFRANCGLSSTIALYGGTRLDIDTHFPQRVKLRTLDLSKEDSQIWGALVDRGLPYLLVRLLQSEQKIYGAIGIHSRSEQGFTVDDKNLLDFFGDQMILALENLQLFGTAEQSAREMAALCDFGVAVGRRLNLDEVVNLIPEELGRLLDISNFYLALYDEEKDELHFKVGYHGGQPLHPCVRQLAKEKGFTEWVVRNGEPLLVKHWDKERETLPVEPIPVHGPPSQSWLGVPMKTQDRVVGVMALHSYEPYAFDETTQQLLCAVANQAAIALENARLYEKRRELAIREERTRMAHEIHDSITQNLSSIKFMADISIRLLRGDQQEAAGWMRKIQQAAQTAIGEMRVSLFDLSSTSLARGLGAALEEYTRRLEECYRLETSLQCEGVDALPPVVEGELFKIAREALINAARHARAQRVSIELRREQGQVVMHIQDDGCGFNPSLHEGKGSPGLTGMRRRAEQKLQGEFDIQSVIGEGTTVTVRVPCAEIQKE